MLSLETISKLNPVCKQFPNWIQFGIPNWIQFGKCGYFKCSCTASAAESLGLLAKSVSCRWVKVPSSTVELRELNIAVSKQLLQGMYKYLQVVVQVLAGVWELLVKETWAEQKKVLSSIFKYLHKLRNTFVFVFIFTCGSTSLWRHCNRSSIWKKYLYLKVPEGTFK